LDEHWLNSGPCSQWDTGLPPGLASRLEWRRASGLDYGIVDRIDLIFFKLYAAADSPGPNTVHARDLLAMAPTLDELENAYAWVSQQDPSAGFSSSLDGVFAHVVDRLDLRRRT
jgi:hypothetical protein